MKNKLVLIIYILLSNACLSQVLSLSYSSKNEPEKSITDSLTLNSKTFNTFNNLKKYNDSTISNLKKSGFLNLLARPLIKTSDSSFNQSLSLGKRYRTVRIEATSESKEIDSLLEITLSRKRNKNYSTPSLLENRIKEIYSYLINKGYTFTTIKTSNIAMNTSDTITVHLNIKNKEKRYIDHIKIKGYDTFPKRYTQNLIKKRYLINEKNLKKIKGTFEKLPFIEIIKESELLFKKDSTTLYVYLKKKNNNALDGLIGFNNTEGTKLEINGYLDLQLNNNFNNAEQIHLIYRGDDQDQTQLDVNLDLPYLFKSKIGLSANLNLLRRDSTYQNSTFGSGLFYSFNPQVKTGLSYKTTNSTTEANGTNSKNFKSQNLKLDFNYDLFSNDELMIYESRAKLEIITGNRVTTDRNSQQLRLNAIAEHNLQIDQNNSINIRGTLNLLDSDDIIFNELYQVGGINSIRGFNQNSIDTSFFTAINTEYRYRISRGIYLHSIIDYGIFEDFLSKKTENIYGIGVGTAILTQSGILRISFANGSFSGANLDFSSTVAHINLKIRF